MDKAGAIEVRSPYVSREYPELDLAPTYLWVGAADSDPYHNTNVSSDGCSRCLRETVPDGLTEQQLKQTNQSGASDSRGSEDNQETSWRQSSCDIDPDFESPEECSTQVFTFSQTLACC